MSTIEQALQSNEKATSFEPQTVYYPMNLGFPLPALEGHFEFAITGQQNEKKEGISHIVKIFESSGARIVSLSFFPDSSFDQFVVNLVCDMRFAKCQPEDLLIRINKSKHVKVAEMNNLDGRIFSNFSFPLTFFGDIRAIAIDTDRFVHLFDNITKMFGAKARDALFENGRIEGAEIVEALKEKLGERGMKDKAFLLANVAGLFQAAGWGKLLFNHGGADVYKVTITDPPSDAEEGNMLKNYFLQGMIAGILECFLRRGTKLSMIREGYEEDKRNLIMYYMDKASIDDAPSLSAEEDEGERVRSVMPENNQVTVTTPVLQTVVAKQTRQLPNPQRENPSDVAADHVNQIIKSINQIQEGKHEQKLPKKETVMVQAQTGQSVRPVEGEMLGFGVQIVQQQQPPPRRSPRDNKKNVRVEEQQQQKKDDDFATSASQ